MFKLQSFEASGDWSSPRIAEYGPSSFTELVEETELAVKESDPSPESWRSLRETSRS